jgi:adenine deaminase
MSNPIESMLAQRISQARGEVPADLVIKNTRIFLLTSGEIIEGDIAVCGETIVGVGETYAGKTEIDGRGLTVVPGFIDSHVHIESSMITPYEFEHCVLPRGTTTACCDPHELSNVAGAAAPEYFLAAAADMIMDLRVGLSSCVPATHLETSGGTLTVEELVARRDRPHSFGLAEFMNVPGVLFRDPAALAKLAAFYRRHIDGHAPLLGGRDLNAYLAAGISTCHESSNLDEAREKLRKGMIVLIREGTVARNLDALAPLLTVATSPFVCFCTDDRNPLDIAEHGHVDYLIRRAIELGVPPLAAYRAASYSAARAFGLRDRGLVAPGYRADLVLLRNLERCEVAGVICAGKAVDDTLFAARPPAPDPGAFRKSLKLSPVKPEVFRVFSSREKTPVIEIVPLSLLTNKLELELPRGKGGEKFGDPAQDVAKVAVLERYGKNGNVGRGFVRGFGLRSGAIASSVGHDSHNICVVGDNDADMALAVNALIAADGGFAVAGGGRVIDVLPLPVGGLISDRPFAEVETHLRRIRRAVKLIGCELEEPFLQLAFLPLPVIPALRITDLGVVDVEKFSVIEV